MLCVHTDWHWIANGDGDDESVANGINKLDECAVDSSTHSIQSNDFGNLIGTQCCSLDGTTAYRDYNGEISGCEAAKGLTFSEAEQYCADRGHRLCTRDDILAIGPGPWEGCYFDAYLVWTADTCGPSATDASAHVSLPKPEPVAPVSQVVTIDLSLTWLAAVAVYTLAILLVGCICHKACSERRRTNQYAKVIDSEEFSDNEARAINVQ